MLNSAGDTVDDGYESNTYSAMVLDGTESLEVSHAGGEFQELTSGLLGDFWQRWELTRILIIKPDYFQHFSEGRRETQGLLYLPGSLC